MRMSELLGSVVEDASGAEVGRVTDVRLVQDGPLLGRAAAFRVSGLVVSPRHTGSFLGYDRGTVRGPWLVERIVTRLHRHARFVPWEDVTSYGDRRVVVGRPRAELPDVPPLP